MHSSSSRTTQRGHGNKRRQLGAHATGPEHIPTSSSDSKRVIYCTNDDLQPPKKNSANINAVDLVTKKITPLITGGINTYGSWSPDMKRIAFRKIIGEENSEVFVADGDGLNQRNLTNNPFFDGWPAWSPMSRSVCINRLVLSRLRQKRMARPRDVANRRPRNSAAMVARRKSDHFTNSSKRHGRTAKFRSPTATR